MDSPPKLTGETLIVHHIPLVHCQVPDRQCCSVSKRTNPFCQPELSITRTSALPDRDLSQTDSLVYSSFLQTSETSAEASDKKEGKARDLIVPSVSKRHNPFLLSEGEDLSFFGDDLGQKSFHLHNSLVAGKPPFHLHELALPPFHLHDSNHIVKSWNMASRSGVVDGQEDKISSDDVQKRNNANRCHHASERMELDECSCHRGSSSSFSFDGGDQEWNQNTGELLRNQDALHSRTCSCSSSELQHCRCYSSSSQSEVIDQQMGYISDSSCNSSDGVLVNFSALYNKMNGQSRSNLNSANLSCDSSFCSHSDTGAFYLDLHSSPTESKMSCESHHPESSGKVCGCQHSSSPVLDANCNSYHLHCEPCASESSDLTACLQSQARLVVATQNYYKLVTCDLSSQSSPSPAGSSITSCSEDHTKGSPAQPTEYYLFRRPDLRQEESNVECSEEEAKGESTQNMIEGQVYVNVSPPNLNTSRQRSRSYDQNLDRSPSGRLGSLERMVSCPVKLSESPAIPIQSSPPKRVTSFAELAKGRKKNGTSPPLRSSGDSSLEFSPIPETQRDCPTFLEERARRSQSLPPMPFVHGLNRSCEGFCLNHAFGDSQALSSTKDSVSGEKVPSGHGAGEQASLSLLTEADASFSGGSANGHGQRGARARADGGGTDSKPVVRYSKDQRPTTLPIQPFVFQHHFSKPPKARALHSHFASSLSQLYSLSSNRSASQQISSNSQSSASATLAEQAAVAGSQAHGTLLTQRSADGAASRNDGCIKKPAPETTRPSPLGSYSPVRCNVPFFQSVDSSSSPTAERAGESQPPRSRSCPISASLLPTRSSPAVSAMQPSQATKADALRQKENPKPVPKKEAPLEPSPPLSEYRLHTGSLPPLSVGGMPVSRVGSHADPHWRSGGETSSSGPLSSMGIRPLNANHLSPQALKWREYRRRNPLGLDRISGLPSLAGSLDRRQQEPRLNRGNPIFELPGTLNTSHFHCKLNGQSMRQLQLTYTDFFPDYFSLAEKPPAEFCLSPDGNTESISIDLLQKKGLVKAINTAVDLIVAHFGTSRDPGVKAKLGNSSVSPNVGHLILKYLCPAVRDILSDGLKAYVLDMIIGQRRNIPWSVVEASTQLGPSTKLLHSLYSKISQYMELTNHTMRFNAFIFGLLNIRSLEFWFNHLYNHEDIILAHYQPVGFLCLSHSVCQPLFEELLLLLQPLSLLPFNLDLLFEHHLMQMGKEQQQQKELLRVKQDLLLSAHSTLQLMRTRGSSEDPDGCSTAPEACKASARDGDISPGHSPQQAASERVKGVGASCGDGDREEEGRKTQESAWEGKKDKQAGWWYQLMQSSQIYIEGSAEGSKFVRYEKKKKALNTVPRSAETRKAPPPREGVVEGAEACPIAEGTLEERAKAASKPSPEATEEPLEKPQQVPVGEEVKERSWPFWMGSPPDSVLTELKRSKEKETGTQQRVGTAAAASREESSTNASEGSQPIKWGHLFGSRKVQKEHRQPNRLPSGWLSLDKSVFQLVAQTVGASMWREAAPEPEPSRPEPPEVDPVAQPARGLSPHPPCEVKALCHHIATEAGQLSFNKGDILQVISKVDGDWLQCSLGSEKGLVPIMYVTHPEDEDY